MASAHTLAQPGLQTTSWDPENDLMKQFVVEITPEGGTGWLALASFPTIAQVWGFDITTPFTRFRIWDQFNNVAH